MNKFFGLVATIIVVSATVISALMLGAAELSIQQIINALFNPSQDLASTVIWELRMPRTIMALVAGAGLALAGAILQTVTRNPLADPYLFGISSGASFGAVLAIGVFGANFASGFNPFAFIGSLFATLLLLLIAGKTRARQVESMVLAGVALSFLFSAFTSLILYWSDPQAVSGILFWTLGSFARADWQNIWLPAVCVALISAVMLLQQKSLSALLLGDENATTLGINVKQLRLSMLLLSAILTASIVSICGGIGFVGLMIPHIVRYLTTTTSKTRLILTAITGGVFMIWVDVFARTLLDNQELPIGIITAAIGSCFFLSILYLRQRRQSHFA